MILEQVDIGVHTAGGRRAEATRSHALRRLGRTCIIDRMILEILGHRFAFVEHLLDAGMGDVARDDQRAFQVQARLDRVFRQNLAHLVHSLVQIDVDGRLHARSGLGQETGRIFLELLE